MSENKINPSEILTRIDAIIADTTHISRALEYAKNIDMMAGAVREHPIASIVTARETTNQRMIDLLEKMLDDSKPQRPRRSIFEPFTTAKPQPSETAECDEPTDCECEGECDCDEAEDNTTTTFFGININREKVDEFRRDAEKFVREWAGTAHSAGRTAAEAAKEAVKAARDTVRNARADVCDCDTGCDCEDIEVEIVSEDDDAE